MSDMSAHDWLTIAAVLVGPTIGVLMTFLMQHIVSQRDRRLAIFRALMATRRNRLSQQHVEALNLVEVEFHKKKDVIDKWNDYFEHLGTKEPENEKERDQFYKARDKKLALLVQSIGLVLGRRIEQFDIWEGGYVPRGWEADYSEQQLLRHYLLSMLRGQSGLPVIVHQPKGAPQGVYPPPPD
ncbi:MAG: DUF6680 family protein [Opitutaceae bacterium]